MAPKRHRPPWAPALETLTRRRVVARGILSKTMHHIDVPLLKLSRGRLSMTFGYPVLLLTTLGVKSHRSRTVPLLYVDRGSNAVAIIGTSFGSTKHPAWYYNLKAEPDCTVEIKGQHWRATAREATPEEREEIWAQAVRNYSGYEAYKDWTEGRVPPIFVLARGDT